jgi:hypothetical protein
VGTETKQIKVETDSDKYEAASSTVNMAFHLAG